MMIILGRGEVTVNAHRYENGATGILFSKLDSPSHIGSEPAQEQKDLKTLGLIVFENLESLRVMKEAIETLERRMTK